MTLWLAVSRFAASRYPVVPAALGWEVTYSDDSYGMVEGNGIKIGFGKVEGFRPAQWPDEAGAKRFHLDLQVDDLDEAAESLCAIGASQPSRSSSCRAR